MNWLFKSEKLLPDQRRALMQGKVPRDFSALESSRRRWKIKKSDRLIIIRGTGEELTFVAHGVVDSAKQWEERPEADTLSPEKEPERFFQIELRASNFEPFEKDRTLSNFMFSLKKVYNFSQPWRHFRHRGGISDTDFDTLIKGRIAWDRSTFYGLLRHLPEEWRAAFELQAGLNSLADRETRPIAGIPPLFNLLERAAVTPLVLSNEVSILASAAFPTERLNFVMGPGELSEQQPAVDLLRLFRLAEIASQSAEAQLKKLREEDAAANALHRLGVDDWEDQWLPHRW